MLPVTPDETVKALEALRVRWSFHARQDQLPPPGDWRTWVFLAGRGAGKTRAGAETIRYWVDSGRYKRIHLIAPTAADVRDVMVDGPAGILSVYPDNQRPEYHASIRRVKWRNGAVAILFSAEEPDRLRGPQCEAVWCDELAAWRYPDTWDMAMMGLRLGSDPRAIVTTTPRPTRLLKSILCAPTTAITKCSTWANKDNLAQGFLHEILTRYQGTRLGRQELEAELLEDNPNALWTQDGIDTARVTQMEPKSKLARVVVAIDPSATVGGDETGIVVAATTDGGHFYVLDDVSMHGTPHQWASAAVSAYHKHKADRIVYESNQGGDMVANTLLTVDANVPLQPVHASRGKITRAEPIAALYEQGRVHHLGFFRELETQMCEWAAGSSGSPDRMDALVWALTALSGTDKDDGTFEMPVFR